MSASVRFWRGGWIVDLSTEEGQRGGPRKRRRSIISFGAGAKAKAAAEAYRDEIAPKARVARFWERQSATFGLLWQKFDSQLVGPVPGPATI
jgi:hypothetical protein